MKKNGTRHCRGGWEKKKTKGKKKGTTSKGGQKKEGGGEPALLYGEVKRSVEEVKKGV